MTAIIATRRQCRDEVFVYYDVPGDTETWDENAKLIAKQYGISVDEAHRRLCRAFPDIYEAQQ